MSRVVAITPTLADAVLSIGGTLAHHAALGHEVIVVTVFDHADDHAVTRELRDLLGLSGVVRVDVPPATARGYDSPEGRSSYDGIHDDDEDAAAAVGAALAVTLSSLDPALALSPLGLAGHVDARLLNDALDALAVSRLRWLDLPYALHRTAGAPLGAGEIIAVPVCEQLDAKLAACDLLEPAVDAPLLRAHAEAEGERLGAGGPVELLLRRDSD